MLKGISPVVSPTLLKILAEMGHGDEIIISDAHFPAHTFCSTVVRADGLGADALLKGIIPLFELDSYATPVIMMEAVPGDTLDPAVEAESGWNLPEAATVADGHKLLPLIKYYKTPDAVAMALRQKVVF